MSLKEQLFRENTHTHAHKSDDSGTKSFLVLENKEKTWVDGQGRQEDKSGVYCGLCQVCVLTMVCVCVCVFAFLTKLSVQSEPTCGG